jgi:hypothetical protein
VRFVPLDPSSYREIVRRVLVEDVRRASDHARIVVSRTVPLGRMAAMVETEAEYVSIEALPQAAAPIEINLEFFCVAV